MTTWAPWPGDPRYLVSTSGEVRGVRGVSLRPGPVGRGYLAARIGHRGRRLVHHMVLEAFVGPRPDGMVTRHLDGDMLNNHLANLAYGTYSENNRDTARHGRHNKAGTTACPHGHPYDEQNTVLRKTARGVARRCRTCIKATPRPRCGPKTHCKRGHAFDEANTYVDKRGGRVCRACQAAWQRARRTAGQRVSA